MINLLPPDIKENYRYARRNTRMIKWVVAFSFALVGLAALSVGGIFYLDQTASSYDSQVQAQQDILKSQDQAGTQKQVKEVSDSLKLVVDVLSQQVLYSKLLEQLATIIPEDAALANLNINQVQGALDITANTADYTSATQLQVNMADPANKIFNKADIVNIACNTDSQGAESAQRYPCTVTVRALFSADNPFLFVNNKATPAGTTP